MMSDATTPNPLIENDYFYLSSDGTYYIVGVEDGDDSGEPFEINGHLDIPAESAVVTKKMFVESMKIL